MDRPEKIDCNCPKFRGQMFRGEFGLEMETLRVDEQGHLAKTSHPFEEEAFSRDFAECQLEMVTPVCHSTRELYDTMNEMHQEAIRVLRGLNPPEYLWPCSNPGIVDGDIPVARFQGELAWKTSYRRHLSDIYGREKMLFSGIHYNFSFPRELIPGCIRDRLYLNLARHLYANAYLPVLLMAASPVADATFMPDAVDEVGRPRFASIRCGEQGYWNHQELYLDFSTVEAYVDSVEQHMDAGDIQMASELYLPVRLKSPGAPGVEGLTKAGISYVEYRMVDLNPLEPNGIDYRDLEFLHLMMIYLTFLPEGAFPEEAQHRAIQDVKQAALLDPPQELIVRANQLLKEMRCFFQTEKELIEPYINYQQEKLDNPQKRYAYRMIAEYGENYPTKLLERIRED